MKILIFNKVCLKSYIKSQSIICLVIIFQPWCILATNQSRLLHIYECSTVVSMWLTVWCYLVNLYNLAIFVSCARVFFVVFLSVNFHINPDLFPLRFPFFPLLKHFGWDLECNKQLIVILKDDFKDCFEKWAWFWYKKVKSSEVCFEGTKTLLPWVGTFFLMAGYVLERSCIYSIKQGHVQHIQIFFEFLKFV